MFETAPLREKFAVGVKVVRGLIEDFILISRYALVPMFCALLYVIVTITYDFFLVLSGRTEAAALNEHTLMALELLDITMIANLIWLISAGSYYVFVDNYYPGTSGKKRPRCLAHISSGILKEKMAGSLIGVSSVHLLQIFLHLSESKEAVNIPKVAVLVGIHLVFIVGLVAFNHTNAADHHNHDKQPKEVDHASTDHS